MVWLIDGDATLTPTVSVRLATGHTVGHQVVDIVSPCGAAAVWLGDVVHHALQLRHPTLCLRDEHDSTASIKTRCTLLEEVAQTDALLLSPHLPFPGAGRVVKLAERGAFEYHAIVHEQSAERDGATMGVAI
jgi:hypothetical protein